MNIVTCISSLIVASLIYGIVNAYAIKKQQTILLAKKMFSFFSVVFGLMALELGGSMMLGTCQEAYTTGLMGLLYVVGISIGFLLLGFGFAAKMKAMKVESTIDIFEIKYRSPLIRTCASFLSILTLGGLLIGQVVAAKSLVHALGIHNDLIFILIFACIIAYTVVGGLKTAGITYSAQLIYTLVVFSGIFGVCLFKEPPSFFTDILTSNTLSSDTTISFSAIFASIVMPALYYLTDQEFAQPLFGISTKSQAAGAAICASICMVLFSLVPIYFGIKARALQLVITDDMSPLIPILKLLTNNLIVVLALIGIAASLIAMIDYYLWAVSLSITNEISVIGKSLKENTQFNKYMVIIVGMVAVGGSYCTSSNAIQVLLYSYELYDSCLIVPLLMSYFQSDLKKGSAIGAFLLGLSGFFLFRLIPLAIPGQIASLLLSFLGFYLGGIIENIFRRIVAFKRSRALSI